jgi:hypothetical protein
MKYISAVFQEPRLSYSIVGRAGFCIFGGIAKILEAGSGSLQMINPKPAIASLTRFILVFTIASFLLTTNCYAECCTGEIRPKTGATSYNSFKWDGKELRPKAGATSKNTWIFDGEEVRKKSGSTASSTYVWTGSQFKPKSGATSTNTWTWSRNELKRLSGATASNTWKFDRCEWTLKQGATSQNSWVVTGFVPVPISALVILGLN